MTRGDDLADPGGLFPSAPVLSSELSPFDGDREALLDRARALVGAGANLLFFPDAPGGRVGADPVIAASVTQGALDVPCVPHLNCRDRNLLALESRVAGARLAGLRGIKAVTGDPVPERPQVYEVSSVELAGVVATGNPGGSPLTVLVGYALHGRDPRSGEERLARKIAAGAHGVVTVPTLDGEELAEFAERIDAHVPLVVSLVLVPSREVMEFLRDDRPPGFRIPKVAQTALQEAATPEHALAAGLDAALAVARRLRERALGFHVVPAFGKPAAALPLLRALREL